MGDGGDLGDLAAATENQELTCADRECRSRRVPRDRIGLMISLSLLLRAA
jgi:hypothetical protein